MGKKAHKYRSIAERIIGAAMKVHAPGNGFQGNNLSKRFRN
jgi:hypothetical protein